VPTKRKLRHPRRRVEDGHIAGVTRSIVLEYERGTSQYVQFAREKATINREVISIQQSPNSWKKKAGVDKCDFVGFPHQMLLQRNTPHPAQPHHPSPYTYKLG
jgi:hypothetical protein